MRTALAHQEFDAPPERLSLPVAKRGLVLPLLIFAVGFATYGACVLGAVLAAGMGVKIALAALAGVFIANLAIIGHDATHRSFTRVRWLNRAIGTAAFLPALHPFGRWEHHHNRVHHCYTAQIGVDNAYSPMTPQQYLAASPLRRLYYRFMRSLGGQWMYNKEYRSLEKDMATLQAVTTDSLRQLMRDLRRKATIQRFDRAA